MDTELTIASKRDSRRFAPTALSEADERSILDAGRLSGSARNQQPWTLIVGRSEAARSTLAAAVYRPELVLGCPFPVLITVEEAGRLYDFDAGRAAQNMMLAAWSRGVVSCPNGIANPEGPATSLAGEGQRLVTVISFGYPETARPPERRTRDQWSARARRRALEDVMREG